MEILHLFFNKKISTQIGIIIVLFFALLIGGFLIWQCKDMPEEIKIPELQRPERQIGEETAGWKTYNNEQHGYSIKYPFELYLSSSSESGKLVVFFLEEYRSKEKYEQPSFSVQVREDKTLEEYLESYRKSKQEIEEIGKERTVFEIAGLPEFEEIRVNGRKAYRSETFREDYIGISTLFGKNKKVFEIGLLSPSEFNEDYVEMYNRMVLSFKILE